jgi:hypothetical protein
LLHCGPREPAAIGTYESPRRPLWVKSRHVLCTSRCPLSAKKRTYSAAKKSLFDHLVGAVEQRLRNSDPERFGGLEIDRQLELDRAWTGSSLGFSPLRMRPA